MTIENLTYLTDLSEEFELPALEYEPVPGDPEEHEPLSSEFVGFIGTITTASRTKTNFALAA